jgi:GNAT superfamily N-acetyltransferase
LNSEPRNATSSKGASLNYQKGASSIKTRSHAVHKLHGIHHRPQWHPTQRSATQLARVSTSIPIPPLASPLTTTTDVPTIFSLIQELAAYEKSSSSVTATRETLERTLAHYDPSSKTFTQGFARTLLLSDASSPDTPVAMALYFYNYSTWTGVPGIYLEDLFVKEGYRNKGYGKMLLKELANEVLKVEGQRLEWSCLDWNEPSLRFYTSEKIGATKKDAWVGLRVDGEALKKLAES